MTLNEAEIKAVVYTCFVAMSEGQLSKPAESVLIRIAKEYPQCVEEWQRGYIEAWSNDGK